MLTKIISGGQTGADLAALVTAKEYDIQTGGVMPKGFRTLKGNRPEFAAVFGMQEHKSANYAPRTFVNVRDSDATLRLAFDFQSPGELCTLKAINQYGKIHLDAHLKNWSPPPAEVAEWINQKGIFVLNVAGNSHRTNPSTFEFARVFLRFVFECLGFKKKD
jgi:hypothetical protein